MKGQFLSPNRVIFREISTFPHSAACVGVHIKTWAKSEKIHDDGNILRMYRAPKIFHFVGSGFVLRKCVTTNRQKTSWLPY